MGAWGAGVFENDDASDWSQELVEGETELREALDLVARLPEDEYLEAPEASCALAAAAVVAAAADGFQDGLPTHLTEWLSEQTDLAAGPLVSVARAAVQRVRERSELRELWDEGDDPAWLRSVDDLAARLASAAS